MCFQGIKSSWAVQDSGQRRGRSWKWSSTLKLESKLSIGFLLHHKVSTSYIVLLHREYLLGFSKRKAERRKFGLAMQKVKDRKARLAARGEVRER